MAVRLPLASYPQLTECADEPENDSIAALFSGVYVHVVVTPSGSDRLFEAKVKACLPDNE
jgi:hypothetical protein